MGISRSSAAERIQREARFSTKSTSRLSETIALVLASSVFILGVFLTYEAKTSSFRELTERIQSRELLNLNEVKNRNELLPFLLVFENTADRQFASGKIYEFLKDHDGPISNVGALAQIRVSKQDIEATRGLVELRERLAESGQRPANMTRWRKFTGWLASWSGSPPSASTETVPLFSSQQQQVSQLKPRFIVRQPEDFRRQFWLYMLIYLAGFYVIHVVWRARRFQGDRLLLPTIHLLSGIGIIMMLSLRDPLRDIMIVSNFSLSVVVGCLLLLGFSLVDYQRSHISRLSFVFLILALLLSTIMIIFGSGPGTSDATINLLGVQPVEAIKILVVLFLAGYFAERWESLRELKEKSLGRRFNAQGSIDLPRLRDFLPVLLGMGMVLGLFFLQKDLGPAIVLALLFLGLYGVARNRFSMVLVGLLLVVTGFWVGYRFNLTRTVVGRIHMWLSPWDNAMPGGDQVAHSLWGISTGGFSGTGLGLGSPTLIPASYTDLILSAIGEELGFVGIIVICALYFVLIQRGLRASLRAQSDYTFFLGLGLIILIALPPLLIAGGLLGLLPLSGVASPFLSYGGSAMLANFAIFGVLSSISAQSGETARRANTINAPFQRPVKQLTVALVALAIIILARAAQVQVWANESTLLHPALTKLADGSLRYQYNPRLLEIARQIPRGTIYDRNGIPLATSDWAQLQERRKDYERLGITIEQAAGSSARYYPFGALTFYLLGDERTRFKWRAKNTDFVEREAGVRLQGYDDRETAIEMRDPQTGQLISVLQKDYSELLPLLNHRYEPTHADVQRILSRDRDVRTSLDIRFQQRVAAILSSYLRRAGRPYGAAVVMDVATGETLARVSYPMPDTSTARGEEDLFDRAFFGVYPPGSTFKLVTAIAALRKDANLSQATHECRRLPDGRVGNEIRGWGRPVRDDIQDRSPHGRVNMERGLVVSCNAYFAQLGVYDVGSEMLRQVAETLGIKVAEPNTAEQLKSSLPQASYGQGQVIASPFQIARVAATIANGGMMPRGGLELTDSGQSASPSQLLLNRNMADLLARYMREVVLQGTGRNLRSVKPGIAGKTGTAEIEDAPSHSWFTGFAPYEATARRRIAFCVVIENAGYGGAFAAPAAGEIVEAARDTGIIQ